MMMKIFSILSTAAALLLVVVSTTNAQFFDNIAETVNNIGENVDNVGEIVEDVVDTAATVATTVQDGIDIVATADPNDIVDTVNDGVVTSEVTDEETATTIGGFMDLVQGIGNAIAAGANAGGTTNGTSSSSLSDILGEAGDMLGEVLFGNGDDTGGGLSLPFGSVEELVNATLPEGVFLPTNFEFTSDNPFDPETFTLPAESIAAGQTLPSDFSFPENMNILVALVSGASGATTSGGDLYCNLCDGTGFDPTRTWAGITCDMWQIFAGNTFCTL